MDAALPTLFPDLALAAQARRAVRRVRDELRAIVVSPGLSAGVKCDALAAILECDIAAVELSLGRTVDLRA
jgi:hypothetical protein